MSADQPMMHVTHTHGVVFCVLCAQYLAISLARSPLLLVVFGPEVERGAFWGADWG